MDPLVCVDELERVVKTRNLFRVRELLQKNLDLYPLEPEFLQKCTRIAQKDALTFQKHDQEYLNPNEEKWNKSDFSYLKQRLGKNFSWERYEMAIAMAGYFERQKIAEAEEAAKLAAELEATEHKESRAERKRQKKLLKQQKREAQKAKRRSERNLPAKQILLGVQVSGLLLIYYLVYLIITEF
ncbi:MAG: hypothetical protein FWF59_10435 [Turicibacter sp.]|nr:hypothetical protein [Turicibacter sp.]